MEKGQSGAGLSCSSSCPALVVLLNKEIKLIRKTTTTQRDGNYQKMTETIFGKHLFDVNSEILVCPIS